MKNEDLIHSIWQKFKSGDKEAFAYFYNLHIDSLYHYGTKISSDEDMVKDAIQEVFLDLYLKREKNKTNPLNLQYYLILALKRNLIKRLKGNRKFIEENPDFSNAFEPVYSIETQIIESEKEREINDKLVKAINQLSPKLKEIIYLRFNRSLEYNEIAKILNISVESTWKQVSRALKVVRDIISSEAFIFLALIFSKNNSKKLSGF